jgi:hypothetical protein
MIDHLSPSVREALDRMKRVTLLTVAVIVATVPIMLLNQTASAAQVTSRSLLISTAQASASATYTFGLVPATAAAIQGLKFQACTTALGACTAPTGLSFSGAGATGIVSGWTTNTNFTTGAGANDCTASASILCANRTAASNETGAGIRTVAFTTITNQNNTNCSSAANCTFFVRLTTYNLTTYTVGSTVDTGTVASSTTQLFTVNAAIQEQLTFCVGATTVNDSNTTTPPLCASVSGTSLNLGTLTSSNTSVSPVLVGNGGDGNNGIAELSTNATNGSTVAYDAKQQAGTLHLGTLRVAGATCLAGAVTNDQCINAIGTTQSTITAGTEAYGMTIAAVNCKATTAYACSFTGATYNLIRNANYDGTGANTYPTDTDLVAGTTNAGYAWDETGATSTIASSTTVVDKEALILKFATTPNIVTPSGSYTALADFVATPTF